MNIGDDEPIGRFFTPDEANRLLPEVRVLLENALQKAERLRNLSRSELGEERRGSEPEADQIREEVATILQQIKQQGVEVKGLELGLLDFPAMRNGRVVYLCWRAGEKRVEHWHPMHTGFAGRKRIDEEPATWEWRN